MKATYLAEKFAAALPYDRYVLTGTDEQQRRWQQFHDSAHLTGVERDFVAGFVREMKVLVISGVWCGDCVQQCPLIEHIAEANRAKVELRFLDRDEHMDLMERF